MSKKSIVDAPKTNAFMIEPEKLKLITEKDHPLYDKRVHDAPEDGLIKNIMVYGVIEPVIVRKNGEEIEVIAGRQRVMASVEANKRLEKEGKEKIRIPIMFKRGEEADLFGVTISENEQRREDNPLAKSEKAQRLMNMGKTEEEIAIAFGVSKQTIMNWLKLNDLSASIRKAVDRKEITATAAIELSSLSGEEQKKRLEKMKEEGGKMTVDRVKRVASTGDSKPTVRIKSRKEITETLNAANDGSDYQKGYTAALRWVLGL